LRIVCSVIKFVVCNFDFVPIFSSRAAPAHVGIRIGDYLCFWCFWF